MPECAASRLDANRAEGYTEHIRSGTSSRGSNMKRKQIVILCLVGILVLGLFAGCGKKGESDAGTSNAPQDLKTAASPDSFVSLLQKNGFEVVDYSNQFGEGYTVYGAVDPSMQYQIQFFRLPDEEAAKYSFDMKQSDLAANKVEGNEELALSGDNYESYALTTESDFLLISRIADTFLYADVPNGFESEVKDIAEKLGY